MKARGNEFHRQQEEKQKKWAEDVSGDPMRGISLIKHHYDSTQACKPHNGKQ